MVSWIRLCTAARALSSAAVPAAVRPSRTGFRSTADRRRVPLTVVDLSRPDLQDRLSSGMLLVRPDQHVAWAADAAPTDPGSVLDRVRSGPGPAGCRPLPAARPSVPPTCAARPAADHAGRPFPTDADLPAKTARTDQALPGPVWRIGSQTRGLARPSAALSSLADSPTLETTSRGRPPWRRLSPPPCSCTHQNPLTWVYEAPQLSSDLIRRTGPGRLDQRHRPGRNRWGRIGLRRGCFEGFCCGTWPYGGR